MADINNQDIQEELQKTNKLLSRFTSKSHAFLRGIMGGLGASLGATILITFLLWTLSQLEYVPFVGQIVENFNSYLRENVPSSALP